MEIRRLRLQQWKRHRWAMWARTTLLSLPFSVGFFFLFEHTHPVVRPGAVPISFLLPPVFCWLVFFLMPFLESLPYPWNSAGRWRWDDDAVTFQRHPISWSKFQQFRMTRQWGHSEFEPIQWVWGKKPVHSMQASLPPGFATFGLQFRHSGRWQTITAREDDVARIAETARMHLPRETDFPPDETPRN